MTAIVPIPKVPIAIRLATMEDFPAIDALQKKYNKALSFFPKQQFEGYIKLDGIRVAETVASDQLPVASENAQASSGNWQLTTGNSLLGYIVSRDRYLKRDELGVIYQLCVAPGAHRQLIGAALVREVFENSAYGCKLYCLWCAQDLDANHFWEAMGFTPIAFRAGSEKKRRVHIFWEKRIREGDATTPWWFPAKTEGGAMRADRLVFPIPPGKRWSDEMPVILPGTETRQIEDNKPKAVKPTPVLMPPTRKYVQFGSTPKAPPPPIKAPKAKCQKPVKQKLDPKYIAAARELRDRYLEHIKTNPAALEAPSGKYQVVKQIVAATPAQFPRLLEAA